MRQKRLSLQRSCWRMICGVTTNSSAPAAFGWLVLSKAKMASFNPLGRTWHVRQIGTQPLFGWTQCTSLHENPSVGRVAQLMCLPNPVGGVIDRSVVFLSSKTPKIVVYSSFRHQIRPRQPRNRKGKARSTKHLYCTPKIYCTPRAIACLRAGIVAVEISKDEPCSLFSFRSNNV